MKRWVPVLFVLLAAFVPPAWGYAPESRLGGMVLAECSFAPVWNVADASGYSFCGGDPLNRFDADGREGLHWFQVLAPATYSGTGAKPYTGSLAGDLQVAGAFYGATLPIQMPGRVYTSEPVQRGMQVVGGISEIIAGAYAVGGSGGFGTTLGLAAICHGLDSAQAGVRGDQSFTAQSLTWVTGSPTWGNVVDAGVGALLNFGAGVARAPMQATGPVTHFTSAAKAAQIAESGRLGAPYGIFGVETAQAPSSWFGRMLLTGSQNNPVGIVVGGNAAAAFRAPPFVGPFSELRAVFGVRSTKLGSIDLAAGQFIPDEVFRGDFVTATEMDVLRYQFHRVLVDYIPDSLFGLARVGAAYADSLPLHAAYQGTILGKKPR